MYSLTGFVFSFLGWPSKAVNYNLTASSSQHNYSNLNDKWNCFQLEVNNNEKTFFYKDY